MRKLGIVSILIILTSCYYKDSCFYAPQSVNCGIQRKSDFDSFQKNGSDDEQKLADMKACLGEYGNNINYKKRIFHDLFERYPRQNVVHNFSQCMRYKGYIFNNKIQD